MSLTYAERQASSCTCDECGRVREQLQDNNYLNEVDWPAYRTYQRHQEQAVERNELAKRFGYTLRLNYGVSGVSITATEVRANMAEYVKTKAPLLLEAARDIMIERGKIYDQPQGERSMSRTVDAFNAITGQSMTESQGWLFMQVLKDVRQWQTKGYHQDSAEDGIAYAALKAECLANGGAK